MMQLFPNSVKSALRHYVAKALDIGNAVQVSSIVSGGRKVAIDDRALIDEYRNTAYYCARINANGVARTPLKLYVATATGQRKARCATRRIDKAQRNYLRTKSSLRSTMVDADEVEEVTEHPLLDLLRNPATENDIPMIDGCDLWSVTQLYQEITGKAYWHIEKGGLLGTPLRLWIVPSYMICPYKEPGSNSLIDYYQFRNGLIEKEYGVEEIMPFLFRSLVNPYTEALGPLQACLQRARIESSYGTQAEATLANRARPDALISPKNADAVMSDPTRKRLQMDVMQHRGAGTGQTIVLNDPVDWTALNWSPKDMGELADLGVSIDQIARSFDVPLSMINKDANRASAGEGRTQHAKDGLLPRLTRNESVINSRLVPLYDDSGRLFASFDNPVPEDKEFELKTEMQDLQLGVRVINEIRNQRGADEVEWGEEPWMSSSLTQPSTQAETRAQNAARMDALAAMSGKPGEKPDDEKNDKKDDKKKPPNTGDKALLMSVAKLSPEELAIFQHARERLHDGTLDIKGLWE